MNTSKLTLTLYSAEGLHETGKIKKQDPYTIVEVGERVFKTKADSSAGSDPVWNEELQCEVPTGVTTASFTIHDKNLFVKDDIIGVAKYDFTNASGEEETIPVFTKEGTPAGHLKLRAVYSGSRGTTGRGSTGAATGAPIGAAAGTAAAAPLAAAAGHTDTGARGAQATGAPVGTATRGPAATATGVAAGTRATTHDSRDVASSKTSSTATGAHGTAAPGAHGTAALGTGVASGPTETRTAGTETGAIGAGREVHAKGAPGFTGTMPNLEGQQGIVCDQKFYVVEEDRPIVKEVKQYVREHHPVMREMIVETKPTGREREMPTGPAELVGVQEKVIETTTPKPCP